MTDLEAPASFEDVDDTANRLEAAGFSMARISEEQRQVLNELSDEEVRLLTSIKQRLEAAGAEVEGHLASSRGDVADFFW